MKDPNSPISFKLTFIFFFILPFFASSMPLNQLPKGSSLSIKDDNDYLVSPDGSFSCGFYKVGSNAYTFSIWFAKSATKTLAWTANRDHPMNGHGSRLVFWKDGGLVLKDADDTVVWSTNTSSTGAAQMQLLDSGNLVVVNKNGKTLWQSFYSPTDTLLPTQPVTRNIKLISSIAKGSTLSGYYSLYFDTYNVLRMVYDGPEISSVYWPNPNIPNVFFLNRTIYNNSRFGVLDDEGQFMASDLLAFNASDRGLGVSRRLTLDYDGNLRLYSLNATVGMWYITWEALPELCNVHGLCGRNGICVYAPKPQCSCPPGYLMKNTTDWNQGCMPKIAIDCNNHQKFKFVKLPNSDFWGNDLKYKMSTSFEDCKMLCREECQCTAFGYRVGTGECYLKVVLYNGWTVPGVSTNIYLKVDALVEASDPSVSQVYHPICGANDTEVRVRSSVLYSIHFPQFKWLYLYWFIGAFFLVEVLFISVGWWFILRSGQMPTSLEEGYRMLSRQFKKFTYKELKRATRNFKEELGRGGSGIVYKGVLDDERVVAVKKLDDAKLGDEEFWAEVSIIGTIYHMNLVRMWGFCSEQGNKLLVSEFVDNGSLEKILFDGSRKGCLLDWTRRYQIAVGVAKGLAYLHHECLEWVIHCDVKPENILLDCNFEPKIADFGLAKLLNRGGGASNLSHIRGTRGYIAPEWASNLPITGRVDVYSYGVVLLEIVKGSRVSNWVIDWADGEDVLCKLCAVLKEKLERGEESWVDNFADCRLNGQFNFKQAVVMVQIALSCLEEDRNRRPTMDSIVRMLLSCDGQASSTL